MKRSLVASAGSSLLAGAVALGPPSLAASAEAPRGDTPVFGVETSVVLLDVVVRDKKGRPVRNLKASDFEVFEDGKRQELVAFRIYGGADEPEAAEAAATTPAPAASSPAAPAKAPEAAPAAPRPSIIAFVFDRMTPLARATARKAALGYLERGHVEGDLVGVFAIDLALTTLVPYTQDMRRIRPAFQQAGALADTQFASTRADARSSRAASTLAQERLETLAGGADTGSGDVQATAQALALEAELQESQARLLRAFDSLERDQQGFASTNGLSAIVSSLKTVPGRKTVIFFSEGLNIPANVYGEFRTLIATANQANVSVYAVDTGGLRTESGAQEGRAELDQLSSLRRRQEQAGLDNAPGGSMLKQLERNEDMLRLNPESGLGQLAEETGGFLIRDTNDPSKSFGRIQEDMRFHYLLSYAPSVPGYDGRFRSVAVKVARPGLEVQARKGYYAVRPDTVVPVRSHEGPALAFLDSSKPPSDFPVQAAALSFPETKRPGRVPILVEIPGTALTFVENKGKQTYEADFSVTVRLRDQQGLEVDRLSQQYPLSVPAAKLESAKGGNVLFFKETDVAPGRYTMEAVAYDTLGKKASVRRGVVLVPEVAEGRPRLSSLLVLQRIERLSAAEKGSDNPLYYGETVLYPNMGAPLKKSVTPHLGVFFTAYGMGPGTPVVLELTDGTQTLARMPLTLGAADAEGRIQHAATLPLTSLTPGDYGLRLTVGTPAIDSRETSFTVQE